MPSKTKTPHGSQSSRGSLTKARAGELSAAEEHSTPPLPVDLTATPRWLLWRAVPQPGKLKPRRVPHYINGAQRSGKLDDEADTTRLATYEDACAALAASGERYAGLGFALGAGFAGIDLDGVRDPATGKLAVWADEIVTSAGSYAEVSPSGEGVHIIGRGNGELRTLGSNGTGVEFYSHGRYFTMTGIALSGHGLADLASVHPTLAARHDNKPKPSVSGWQTGRSTVIDCLKRLDPDMGYDDWLRTGMAIHHACGGGTDGLDLWREWSMKGAKHVEGDCDKRWGGFKETDGGVTLGTLIHMARTKGDGRMDEGPTTTQATSENARVVRFTEPRPVGFEAVFDVKKPDSPPVLIDGLLPCDAFGMVGAGGTTKTSLMQWLMVHVNLGKPVAGRRVFTPGPTLIVSAEDDAAVLRYRLREIADALGLTKEEREQVGSLFHIEDVTGDLIRLVESDRRGNLIVTPHVDDLIAAYARVKPRLVAFDPSIYFGPGERFVNDSEAALMQVARRFSRAFGGAVGYLHHVGKTAAEEGDVGQYAGRGGSAFADNSRALLAMTRHAKDVRGFPRPDTVSQQDVDEDRTVRLHVAKFSAGKREQRALWVVRGRDNPWQFTVHEGPKNTKAALRERVNEQQMTRTEAAIRAVLSKTGTMRLDRPAEYPSKEAIVSALIGTDSGEGAGTFSRSLLRDAVALAEQRGLLERVEVSAPGRSHGFDLKRAENVGEPTANTPC